MARKRVKGKSKKKGMSRLTKGLVKAAGIVGGGYMGAMGGSLAGGIIGGAVGATTRNPILMGAGAVGGSLAGAVTGGIVGAKKGHEEAGHWITMRGRKIFIKNKKGAKAVVKAKGK